MKRMGGVNTFEDIKAWQYAHEYALKVYSITLLFPRKEDFCLSYQLRKSALSVPSNIVEGFARKSKKSSQLFYQIALGSLEESKYQLLFAKDLKYISEQKYTEIIELANKARGYLIAWSNSCT